MRPFLWFATLVALVLMNLSIAGARSSTASQTVVPNGICNSSQPCIKMTNKSTGEALDGQSYSGNGIGGATYFASTPTAFKAGVLGIDFSPGRMSYNAGVMGTSAFGNGVYGVSQNSIVGAGVRGAGNQIGVYGESLGVGGGIAFYGISRDTNGLMFFGANTHDLNKFIVDDNANVEIGGTTQTLGLLTAVNGINGDCQACPYGVGVVAQSDGPSGLWALANSPTTIALEATGNGGHIIDAQNSAMTSVFNLDDSGNITISGKMFTSGPCSVGCAPPHHPGAHVVSYAPQESQPTMEDFGEAQLVSGQGYVRLDPAYANVIQDRANYLVFITPEGESRGLYVTQKSGSGFAVRENGGGHATLAFSYRIVARPFGDASPRLPMAIAPAIHRSPPHAAARLRVPKLPPTR